MATEAYGVSETASGVIIESITESETAQIEQVPDQQNQIIKEIQYDTRYDLNLTYRGTKLAEADGSVTVNSKKWIVDSHQSAGTYNGLHRYTLTGHRYASCDKATDKTTT